MPQPWTPPGRGRDRLSARGALREEQLSGIRPHDLRSTRARPGRPHHEDEVLVVRPTTAGEPAPSSTAGSVVAGGGGPGGPSAPCGVQRARRGAQKGGSSPV